MAEKKFKPVRALLIAAALMLLGLMVYGAIQLNRPPPPAPLPNPNGYDDLVKAQKLTVAYPGEITRASAEQLREHLARNVEALKLIREGLTKQCRIPISFSTNYLFLRSLADVKRLVWLLKAQGRLAELEHRTNDAARIYVEAIRYGQESCRGGVMIDRLVGNACEALGINLLQKAAGSLDSGTCRETIKMLQEVDRTQEPLADVLRMEREWIRRTYPLSKRWQDMIPIASLNQAKRAQKDFAEECNQSELRLKRLMIDLAARAYELEHRQRPKNWNELVPDYLSAIPIDPASGTNLTYLPQSK